MTGTTRARAGLGALLTVLISAGPWTVAAPATATESASAAGTSGATAAGAAGATAAKAKNTGVPDRVVVQGRCRAAGRYTLRITNDSGERQTHADLRIIAVSPGSVWSLSTQTETLRAGNSTVVGFGDGKTTADEDGRISVSAATPYGLRRSVEFQLSEEGGAGRCDVKVSVGRTHTPAGSKSGVRARVGVAGLCSGAARYRARLDNADDRVVGRFHLAKGGAEQQWTGMRGGSTTSQGYGSGYSRSVAKTTTEEGRLALSGRTSRGDRNGFFARIHRTSVEDGCNLEITA